MWQLLSYTHLPGILQIYSIAGGVRMKVNCRQKGATILLKIQYSLKHPCVPLPWAVAVHSRLVPFLLRLSQADRCYIRYWSIRRHDKTTSQALQDTFMSIFNCTLPLAKNDGHQTSYRVSKSSSECGTWIAKLQQGIPGASRFSTALRIHSTWWEGS